MVAKFHNVTRGLPADSPVQLYCLAAMVAEEAHLSGQTGFARDIETALDTLMDGLPRAEQQLALMLSYEITVAGAPNEITAVGALNMPARPHLKLVHSRA